MRSDQFTLKSEDGLVIAGYCWQPDEGVDLLGIVQLHHGMAEHALRYEPVAEGLTQAGYAVYATDHRGHGKTGQDALLGHFADEDGWALAVRDMRRLNDHVKQAHPGKPVAMVAHSMGSLMAQHYAIDHGDTIDALALSGSSGAAGPLAAIGRMVARVERRRLGKRNPSALLQTMSFGKFNNAFKPSRTEFDWLSRDHAEVDKYINDPLCGFPITTQSWVDLLGGLGYIENASHQARVPNDLPVYIFAGALDPVSNATKSLQQLIGAYRKAGLTQVTHRFYPKARHEVFNETNRAEVIADLIAFLNTALEKAAS